MSTREYELSPVENAVIQVKDKTAELRVLYAKHSANRTADATTLTLCLKGIIDAAVNGLFAVVICLCPAADLVVVAGTDHIATLLGLITRSVPLCRWHQEFCGRLCGLRLCHNIPRVLGPACGTQNETGCDGWVYA